jgi:hypothetical protein
VATLAQTARAAHQRCATEKMKGPIGGVATSG